LDNVAQSSNALANSVPPTPIDEILFKSTQAIQTLAAFAHVEQNLTEWATLEGGVRYTSDRRHFDGCLADPGDGGLSNSFTFLYDVIARPAIGEPGNILIPPGGCVTATKLFVPVEPNEQLNQNNVSWRIGPTFKLDSDKIIYANISKGYKAGTFPTLGGVQASQFNPTTQESVVAYEIGSKATLLQRRLQVNGSVFYYDYDNKQILGAVLDPFFGPLQELVNVPKSHIYGAEFQATALVVEGLQVNVSGTYIQSEVTSHFDNFNPYGSPVDFYHSAFPYSPKWQGTADAQYTMPISGSLSAFLGGHFTYTSKTTSAFGADVPYNPSEHANPAGEVPNEPALAGAFNIDSYGLLDLRAGIASRDAKWRVSVWGRNVTNKYYWTSASFIPADATVRFAGMPITYGATFSYRY
jgi:outer membrane receptor protein involved in Fe transport